MPKITPPLRAEPLIDDQGRFTLRWAEYFEDSASDINDLTEQAETSFQLTLDGKIASLQEQIGSGDILTWDDEGSFTWDTDKFTWDEDEA